MVLPILTHLCAFAFGVLSCYALVNRASQEEPMRRLPAALTVLLIAAALVLGLAIQQVIYQRQSDEREACYNAWGEEVSQTLATRSAAGADLQSAEQARDDAIDRIIWAVIGLRADPPTATDSNLGDALADFARARSDLDRVTDDVDDTRSANPYPILDCS